MHDSDIHKSIIKLVAASPKKLAMMLDIASPTAGSAQIGNTVVDNNIDHGEVECLNLTVVVVIQVVFSMW